MAKSEPIEINDSLGEKLSQGMPDGTYVCVTEANIVKSRKQSKKVPYHPLSGDARNAFWVMVNYRVDDPDSDFFGDNQLLRDMWEVFPDIDDDAFAELDGDEKSAIRDQNRRRTERFGQLGVPENRMFQYNARDLDGIPVKVTVENSTSTKDARVKYLNIRSVTPNVEVNDADLSL